MGAVDKYAKISGLSASLLYQERRAYGESLTDTGTRNTIARLDIFTDLCLGQNPIAVRLVGERYLNKYNNFLMPSKKFTVNDLLAQLGNVAKECGEATAALAQRQSIKDCCVEVSQAKEALEKALAMVAALECEES